MNRHSDTFNKAVVDSMVENYNDHKIVERLRKYLNEHKDPTSWSHEEYAVQILKEVLGEKNDS